MLFQSQCKYILHTVQFKEGVELSTKTQMALKNKKKQQKFRNYKKYEDRVGSLNRERVRSNKQKQALKRYRRSRDSYSDEMNLLADQIAKIKQECPTCVVS